MKIGNRYVATVAAWKPVVIMHIKLINERSKQVNRTNLIKPVRSLSPLCITKIIGEVRALNLLSNSN